MIHKILICYDGTEYSLKAVEYTARMVKSSPEIYEMVLFFVLPPLPIDYVEYGDLPGDEDERTKLKRRKEFLDELKRDAERRNDAIFSRPLALLTTYGLHNVQCKFSHCTADIAGEILAELDAGMYKTVVIGRKGKTSLKERLLGGTAEKVIRYIKNKTVWVVE